MIPNRRTILAFAPVLAATMFLGGCAGKGDLVVDQGVGITAVRSPCPAVGIPDFTGDVTTFKTPGDQSAANIDVTASMTHVRSTCDDTGTKVYTEVTFDVLAERTDTRGARQVELPYYAVVLQGGTAVQSKRISKVTVNFADGEARAQASGKAASYIDRTAATLPADIRDKITRKRKAGDADAALDPLVDPEVKAALNRANFELLVGFQLTEDQLAYNATM